MVHAITHKSAADRQLWVSYCVRAQTRTHNEKHKFTIKKIHRLFHTVTELIAFKWREKER